MFRSVVVLLLACGFSLSANAAMYKLTIDLVWPAGYPGGTDPSRHLSHLAVITHDGGADFFEVGDRASNGVNKMAVTGCVLAAGCFDYDPLLPGGSGGLDTEFQAAQLAGDAQFFYGFTEQFSPGSVMKTFEITAPFSLVSLMSMIGPSPDWFVGVDGLDLAPGGVWVTDLTVPFVVYDGGIKSTDDLIFNAFGPASPTDTPVQLLSTVSSHPFATDVTNYGSFRFELQPVPEPGTLAMIGASLLALGLRRRFGSKSNR